MLERQVETIMAELLRGIWVPPGLVERMVGRGLLEARWRFGAGRQSSCPLLALRAAEPKFHPKSGETLLARMSAARIVIRGNTAVEAYRLDAEPVVRDWIMHVTKEITKAGLAMKLDMVRRAALFLSGDPSRTSDQEQAALVSVTSYGVFMMHQAALEAALMQAAPDLRAFKARIFAAGVQTALDGDD